MTPDEFAEKWGDDPDFLAPFPLGLLNQFPLRFADKHFLFEAGLPSGAAPCLSFGPKYASYFATDTGMQIGSNGSGDPIVLSSNGDIHYLNHDSSLAVHYVNRDLESLAEALLQYRHLINETCHELGPDAFLDGLVPLRLRDSWVRFLQSVDPVALQSGSLWAEEAAMWVAHDDPRLTQGL
ncbi:hypothetical protein BH10PSE14_BH10PSE14_29010 [soil metagenome]